MTATLISLPGVRAVILTPPEIAATVAVFYPRSSGVPGEHATALHAYRLAPVDERWELTKDGSPAGDYATPTQALLAMEYDLETTVVARRGPRIALHAGAVLTGQSACLIPGDPDTGKTTTTFNLVELGHPFLSEEIALVDPVTHVVQPFPQSLTLARAFVESIPAEFPVIAGTVVPLDARFARYVPTEVMTEGAPVTRMLIPHYEPGCRDRIETIQPADALTEILGYCFEPNRGEERLFDAVIGLVEACRIERLSYSSVAEARRLLRDLFPSTPQRVCRRRR